MDSTYGHAVGLIQYRKVNRKWQWMQIAEAMPTMLRQGCAPSLIIVRIKVET